MSVGNHTDWLSVDAVHIAYRRHPALSDLSFSLGKGESLAIAGSNGAGKTSLLNAIAGLRKPGQRIDGRITFQGAALAWGDVAGHIRAGIRLVPERDKVFGLLTVAENLQVGGRLRDRRGVDEADVLGWFPRLAERRATLAGNLSGGEQQMLGIALSLLASPSLLLLDEPTLGLAAPVIEGLCDSLAELRRDLGLSVLVAESDSQWLPRLADRALVIDRGRRLAEYAQVRAQDLDAIHDLLLGLAVEPNDAISGGAHV